MNFHRNKTFMLDEENPIETARWEEVVPELKNLLHGLKENFFGSHPSSFSFVVHRLEHILKRCGYDPTERLLEVGPLSKEELLSLPESVAHLLSEIFEHMSVLAGKGGVDESTYLNFCRKLGKVKEIQEYLARQPQLESMHLDGTSLAAHAFCCGTDEQINRVVKNTQIWASELGSGRLWGQHSWASELNQDLRTFSPMLELRDSLRNNLEACLSGTQLRRSPCFHLLDVNAAVELMENDFDLVIGVAQGGINIPFCMEILGQNTLYLRPSRKTNRVTQLQSISSPKPIAPGGSILICEDDAVSGKTLERILPIVQGFDPGYVEVCFSGYEPSKSYSAVKEKADGIVDQYTVPMQLPVDHFMQNLRMFHGRAEQARRAR